MTAKRNHKFIQNPLCRNRGFTLFELIVAVSILVIISVGAINYHYFGTRMALRADAEMTAARTARLILDNWKKTGGDEHFNPVDLDMGFEATMASNQYQITVNELPLTVGLRWQNVIVDAAAATGLRQLEITVRWRMDYRQGTVSDTDPTYVITTYVRRDESEG